jgi:hypothetical protein
MDPNDDNQWFVELMWVIFAQIGRLDYMAKNQQIILAKS